MWYLHKLMDGDLTNYIVVTRYDINYNCEHICLGRSRSKTEMYVNLHRLWVGSSSVITPKGSFETAAAVARSEGLSTSQVQRLLKGCRNWSRQWPPGWSEAGVRGPRVWRGRILHVGDVHFWEAYCFDDEIVYDLGKALYRVENIHWGPEGKRAPYDPVAYQAALNTGVDFPDGTGCIANGKYYGDDMTFDEIEKLDNDLFRSLVC